MINKIISGKVLADKITEKVKLAIMQEKIKPALAVILVGDDPASKVYVKNKQKKCHTIGIESVFFQFPSTAKEKEIIGTISKLNIDKNIHGILLQLPLPVGFDQVKIIQSINPLKDVDGLHPENLGLLMSGRPRLVPCTPIGCLEILKSVTEISGKNIVIVGRSILVGKPLSMLLTNYHATVTLAHSHTKNLKSLTKLADILIVAIGNPGFITQDYIKKDSIILDVGINRIKKGETEILTGDVDFDNVFEICKYITPVPGGIGLLTVANLMQNVYFAYHLQAFFV